MNTRTNTHERTPSTRRTEAAETIVKRKKFDARDIQHSDGETAKCGKAAKQGSGEPLRIEWKVRCLATQFVKNL